MAAVIISYSAIICDDNELREMNEMMNLAALFAYLPPELTA